MVRVSPRPGREAIDPAAMAADLRAALAGNDLRVVAATSSEWLVDREGGQATQADRELTLRWAEGWRALAEVAVSDLIDLDEYA